MISALRNSVVVKILWGVMGLYLLNISVDTADARMHRVAEDLSINDQESIIELVVEKVLGYEYAIKEYDDNDFEKHGKNPTIKIDFFKQHTIDYDFNDTAFETKSQKFWNRESFLRMGYLDRDIEPPKVWFSYS